MTTITVQQHRSARFRRLWWGDEGVRGIRIDFSKWPHWDRFMR